jgi:dynamin 1-like protein
VSSNLTPPTAPTFSSLPLSNNVSTYLLEEKLGIQLENHGKDAPIMASLGEDLLHIVNKLQDLVFNTIGNDSLDLPQIVRSYRNCKVISLVQSNFRYVGCSWLPILRKVVRPGKYCWQRFPSSRQWHCHKKATYSSIDKRTK